MNRDITPALSEMRRHYQMARLDPATMIADPILQFQAWMADAVKAEILEPNAMTLATATPDGRPLARTVLLKGLDSRGFVFYTNFESRKSRHMLDNPHVSLVFPWILLERQVIITGSVTRVSPEETEVYFRSRPRESQIGAWASPQSRVISGREVLEAEWAATDARYPEGAVPVPPHWGGFRVRPETIEFWQGGAHRLHDRLQYTRQPDDSWVIDRLAP